MCFKDIVIAIPEHFVNKLIELIQIDCSKNLFRRIEEEIWGTRETDSDDKLSIHFEFQFSLYLDHYCMGSSDYVKTSIFTYILPELS